ncbi:phage/plasmid primase, P4 family [Mesorhizobium sp. ORM8.1]
MTKRKKTRPVLQLKDVTSLHDKNNGSIRDHALRYSKRGFAVLPLHGIVHGACTCSKGQACPNAGKHPLIDGGVNAASTDPRQVAKWWRMFPEANVGIATGTASGLVVLDIDPRNGGKASLKALLNKNGPLPRAPRVKTGGDGEHRFFTLPDGDIRTKHGRLGAGIDLQAEGAYVVAPPSRHVSGKQYSWFPDRKLRRSALKALPGPWAAAIGGKVSAAEIRSSLASGLSSSPSGLLALAEEVNRLRATGPGKRNDALNLAAFSLGQLVAAGDLARSHVDLELAQAAREIGLDAAEIALTIKSGLGAGEQVERDRRRNAQEEVENLDPLTAELAALGETDADMGHRFARRHAGKVIFTPGRGLLVYDGKIWNSDDARQRYQLAESVARLVATEAPLLKTDREKQKRLEFATSSLSKSALERALDLAKSHLAVDDGRLDSDPLVLNVLNGTVDLRTGLLRSHDPSDHCTMMANVTHDSQAKCPQFLAFLRTAFRADQDLMTFVQKAAGLSLTANIEEHIFFFVYGPGRTGKSTFVNLIRSMLGGYGKHTPTETLLAKHYDNAIPADLARLVGARMVTAIEANWNRAIDEARIKSMTGGEPITARYLRENYFEFRPSFKLWFVANDLPGVRGTAQAFWERARVIPFNVVIADKDRDRELTAKLRAEASGILNWAIEGCLIWQREGLGTCEAVEEASKGWKKAADPLRKFVDEELIRESGSITQAHDLLEHYQAWCRRHGEQALNDKNLKRQLIATDFTHARAKTGSIWKGVKLRLT